MRVLTICSFTAIAFLVLPNGFAAPIAKGMHAASGSASAAAARLPTSLETETTTSSQGALGGARGAAPGNSAAVASTTPPTARPAAPTAAPPAGTPAAPLTDGDKANLLSDQIGKLMIKCMNLLSAQDPLSLDYCKQQRDLADQYPGHLRLVDRVLAHDEYGIALAAFDRKQAALAEFNEEIVLLPKALKPGTIEWSTAYWHRAMIYNQLGESDHADHDYRAAEGSFRKQERAQKSPSHPDSKMKMVLRQHAALLKKEGKTAAAEKLLAEAAE